jgi:hypothetical protein
MPEFRVARVRTAILPAEVEIDGPITKYKNAYSEKMLCIEFNELLIVHITQNSL